MDLPFTAYPSKGRSIRLLLTSGAFIAAGFLIRHDKPVAAWVGISFFGFGFLLMAARLLTKSTFLTVGAHGIEVGAAFRRRSWAWGDISGFGISIIGGRRMVGFNLTGSLGTNKRLAAALDVHEHVLPDNFGFEASELASMLEYWRREYSLA